MQFYARYYQLQVFFLWVIFVTALFSLQGCSRGKTTGRYDPIPGQVLRETLDALARGDDAQALRLLERLRDLYPEGSLPDAGIVHVREREFTSRLNELLRAGKLEQADRLLHDREARVGRSDLLARCERGTNALRALRQACAKQQYTRSADLEKALRSVRKFAPVLNSPAYREWLALMTRRLAGLRAEEKRRALERLTMAYDRAVVEAPSGADKFLAQIRKLDPTDPAVQLAERVRQSDLEGVEKWIGGVLRNGTPLRKRSLLAGLCQHWAVLPNTVRKTVSVVLPADRDDKDTSCLAGLWLRGQLAADGGQRAKSARLTRIACKLVAPSASRLAARISGLVMPAEQFMARPWRTPLPSITDFLGGVRQVRTQMQRVP